MSKSKFIHTLSESKNTSALEQKAIILSFVKNVAFLLGHPVYICICSGGFKLVLPNNVSYLC